MELKRDAAESTAPRHVLAAIAEKNRDGVLIAELGEEDLPLAYVNNAFEAITGYSRADVIGRNCRFLHGADRQQPQIDSIRRAITKRTSAAVTLRNYRKDGTLFWNALRLFPVFDAAGQPTHIVGLMRDVTEARRIAEELDRAEHRDPLTGVYNRNALQQRIGALLANATGPVLVVKLDMVAFHDVNSAFGHDTADELLQEIARRLEALGLDVVARTGGDEFEVACQLRRREDAGPWLQRIETTLNKRYLLPGAEIEARFAIGFAVVEAGSDALALIRRAGAALHLSKRSALREVREFDEKEEERVRERLRTVGELRHAIAKGELSFRYQPIMDFRTGEVVAAESLLRWQSEVLGPQSPERFIKLAEETGLILDIGHWGRCEIARFAAKINRGRARPLRFSANVSRLELTHGDILASVTRALEVSGADPSWLALELTETLMAEHTPELLATFNALRDLGVGISVDDFGTGYSSLRYLERFPLSEIKIDRHFVHGIADSKAKRVIVGAVIDCARQLGLNIVAEGVETEAEKDVLVGMGCPYAQGYLLGMPIDAAAFVSRFAAPGA